MYFIKFIFPCFHKFVKLISIYFFLLINYGCEIKQSKHKSDNLVASESKISTNNLSKEPLENIILRKSVSKSYSLDSLIGFRNLYLGSQIYIYDFSNWEIDTIHGYKETPLIFSKKFNSFSIDYFNVNDISIITINGIVSTIDISFGYSRTPQVKAEEIESSMDFTNMTTNLDGVYGEHISRTLIPRYFEKYHAPIWPPPKTLNGLVNK